MKKHPTDESEQDAAMQVLSDLVSVVISGGSAGSNGETLVKSGGTKWIVAAMKQFPLHEKIQHNGCDILLELSMLPGLVVAVSTTKGAAKALIQAMKNHPTNVVIQCFACAALARLERTSAQIRNDFRIKGGFEVVAKSMGQHGRLVQESCLMALYAAVRNRQNWKELSTSTIVAALIRAEGVDREGQFPDDKSTIPQNTTRILCLVLSHQCSSQQQFRLNNGFGSSSGVVVDPMGRVPTTHCDKGRSGPRTNCGEEPPKGRSIIMDANLGAHDSQKNKLESSNDRFGCLALFFGHEGFLGDRGAKRMGSAVLASMMHHKHEAC